MAEEGKKDGYIELAFGPRWKYIAVVRGFVQNFLAVSLADDAKADKIAMAASELLENAVKYANGEETKVSMTVTPDKARAMTISVSNKATPDSIKTVKELFAKVMAGDPLEAYVAMMREAATRSDGKSQLGLVRIRYETGCKLSLETTDDTVKFTLILE